MHVALGALLSVGLALRVPRSFVVNGGRAGRLVCNDQDLPPEGLVSPQGLAFRVREALIDAEEAPYRVWSESGPRVLKVNLDLLANRARTLALRGDFPRAMETYERCAKLDPLDGRAWLGLSQMYRKRGREDEAERVLLEGLRWDGQNAFLLQAYGRLQEQRGRQDEALELYGRAVRARPQHAASWVACGLLLQKRRQGGAAEACLKVACTVAPTSYYVWQVVGQWHKKRGELSLARAAFRRSLQLNSKNAATYHAWGVLEWRSAALTFFPALTAD